MRDILHEVNRDTFRYALDRLIEPPLLRQSYPAICYLCFSQLASCESSLIAVDEFTMPSYHICQPGEGYFEY
jgi:hypothetical protein